MSIYDDADTGVSMYGSYWYPADACNVWTVIAAIFRANDLDFMYCSGCVSVLDIWDVAHGCDGSLRCVYCGGAELTPTSL